MPWRVAVVALVLGVVAIGGCGLAVPARTNTPGSVDSIASPVLTPSAASPEPDATAPNAAKSPVASERGSLPSDACPVALLPGFLVAQGDKLVVVMDPQPNGLMTVEKLIWLPWEFSVDEADGQLVVVDAAGNIQAREGDHVQLGGGELTTSGEWTVCGGDEALDVDGATPKLPFGNSSINAAKAVEIGRNNAGGDAPMTLVSVQVGPFSKLNTTPRIGPDYPIKPDELVWSVLFTGPMTICPPSPGACYSPRPGQVAIFLDYSTGDFKVAQAYSPG